MPARAQARRAVAAAVAGNVLEWYDFAIYAYMATIIAKKFFPAGDEVGSLLSTFAAFGIGFVARPLGGIVLGRLGDVRGRKSALLITIALMAAGTVMIGLTPTYDSIGVSAPALVVCARLLQGFSAGGEWGGSTAFIVEWAPEGRRGLYGSLQQSSVAVGLLLGATIAALVGLALPPDAMDSWGWRVPFLLGAVIGPVGLYMRRHIGETPAFSAATQAATAQSEWPLLLAARAFGFTVVWTVSYYTVLAYMPTFLQKHAGVARGQSLWYTAAGLLLLAVAAPVSGRVSDRIGRKPLLLAACAGCAVLPYPLFGAIVSHPQPQVVLLSQLALALAIALFSGPGPAAIAEIFPTGQRATWMSTGYSLAVAIFGGFAPFIATWLIDRTGNPVAPAFYLIAAALVSMLAIAPMQETARAPLR
jgi:MHS family proline/betaine transporter-like MFS transporter